MWFKALWVNVKVGETPWNHIEIGHIHSIVLYGSQNIFSDVESYPFNGFFMDVLTSLYNERETDRQTNGRTKTRGVIEYNRCVVF